MKNKNINYIMSILTVLLLLPLINFNLYSDGGEGEGHGHGHGHGNGEGDSTVQVIGLISAITSNSITVDSTSFTVDSNTKVEAEDRHFTFDSLKSGDSVEVKGEYKDSVLFASEIKLLNKETEHGHEHSGFSLSGIISALTDSSLTVDGKNIFLTDSTIYKFEERDSASKSDLKTGEKVEVEGYKIDSSYYAMFIIIADSSHNSHHDMREFEITGKILSIDSNSFTVDTLTIGVDSNTQIEKEHVGKINFSDLKAGDSVEVGGIVDSNTYIARQIHVITNEQVHIEVKGIITNVSDSTIVVNDTTFEINNDTKITQEGKGRVDKSALKDSEFVNINATLEDSIYIANSIEIKESEHDSVSYFELEGLITSISSNTITVNGDSFEVDSNTVIKKGDSVITPGDLTVGMKIEVQGKIINGDKIASKIEVIVEKPENEDIKGEITAIADSTITVDNTLIVVTSDTKIYDKNDSAIQFSALDTGNFVKVRLSIVNDTNYALQINLVQKHNNHHDSDEVSDVEMVETGHLSANNNDYIVDANTQVYDNSGRQIAYSDLKQGMQVYIYEDIKNGQLYASRIDILQAITLGVNSGNTPFDIVTEPNPFSDASTLRLTLPDNGALNVALYNELGDKVLDIYNGYANGGENDFVINQNSSLGAGIYYVRLIYNGSSYVMPVVKIK